MNISIKKLTETAKLPERGSAMAAGYDLFADTEQSIEIYPGDTILIGTGLAIEIPEGYFGAIFARSGLSTKRGLRPANCVGVIDSDYRGEIKVALHSDNLEFVDGDMHSPIPVKIDAHERIAQLVIMPYLNVEFNVVNELNDTERGMGGFGSTGTK